MIHKKYVSYHIILNMNVDEIITKNKLLEEKNAKLEEELQATKDANIFRYSQNQRRKETKMKKYNNIILAMKTNKIQ